MKPLKSLMPIAKWLLRISLILFVYFSYFDFIKEWNFKNIEYITIFAIALFSVLLFIGGFTKKNSLTVVSGLLIFLLSTVKFILSLPDIIDAPLIFCIVLGIYFLASGNYYYYK